MRVGRVRVGRGWDRRLKEGMGQEVERGGGTGG